MAEDRMLRIGYVVPRYSPHIGGVETHVAHLARRCAAHGHTVEVLTQESDASLPRIEIVDGVTVRRFGLLMRNERYGAAPGLWRYLAREGASYNVIHAHSYHALPSLFAALTNPRALVFTPHYHGTGHTPLARLLHVPYRGIGARIFDRADRIICVSDAEAALVRTSFPTAADRLTTIPNGIDAEALIAAEPFDEERTVLLSAGRLEGYKNVDRTIEALQYLDRRFILIVVGDGSARLGLEGRAAALGLADRVQFLGHVSDETLRRWFRTASAYVSMSSHEAYGLTLAEAASVGVPVIASDIPAHREVATTLGIPTSSLLAVDCSPAQMATVIQDAVTRATGKDARRAPSWDEVAGATARIYSSLTTLRPHADTVTSARFTVTHSRATGVTRRSS